MNPSLSILIVNWNTRDFLDACLSSLLDDPVGAQAEIIVVDNASRDGSTARVQAKYPSVTLIKNAENVGYARGNNQAMEQAHGEHWLLLNPDTEVTKDALQQMTGFLETHPESAAVGCRLVDPPTSSGEALGSSFQYSVRLFPSPEIAILEALQLSRLFPRHRYFGKYRMGWWDYGDVREVDQPMASCLLLRRAAIEQVGMMDEQFPIFFNDVDLCYRIKAAGWKIHFTPDAVIVHHGGESTRQAGRQMIAESHRSMLRFYRKHYRGKVNSILYAIAVALIGVGQRLRLMSVK